MKILYYSQHPGLNLSAPAGYGTHMRATIKAFRKLDHEVATCIMGGEVLKADSANDQSRLQGDIKRFVPNLAWETLKDFSLLTSDRHAERRLNETVTAFHPDIIYERGYYLMTSGVRIARKHRVRHIMEMNAPFPEERQKMAGKSLLVGYARHMERKQIRETVRLVVVSAALKEYAECCVPGCSQKVIVTPNAVSPEEIRIDPGRYKRLRQNYAIAQDDIVFGFVGSFFSHHGIDIMIQAFQRVHKKIPKARLLIVGDGEIRSELESLAAALPCSDRICFTGNVAHDAVYDHIGMMDIALMVRSNWYGSPVKIFEYGALGKPVIAPDTAPVREVMTHGQHGLLVPPETDAVAAAMLQLGKDVQLRARLGASFQEKVFREHTWEQMAAKLFSEIDSLDKQLVV